MPAVFQVYPKGEDGKIFLVKLQEVEVTIDGGEIADKPEVIDMGDGTFDVEWQPMKAGTYLIHIKISGIKLDTSPIKMIVREREEGLRRLPREYSIEEPGFARKWARLIWDLENADLAEAHQKVSNEPDDPDWEQKVESLNLITAVVSKMPNENSRGWPIQRDLFYIGYEWFKKGSLAKAMRFFYAAYHYQRDYGIDDISIMGGETTPFCTLTKEVVLNLLEVLVRNKETKESVTPTALNDIFDMILYWLDEYKTIDLLAKGEHLSTMHEQSSTMHEQSSTMHEQSSVNQTLNS